MKRAERQKREERDVASAPQTGNKDVIQKRTRPSRLPLQFSLGADMNGRFAFLTPLSSTLLPYMQFFRGFVDKETDGTPTWLPL